MAAVKSNPGHLRELDLSQNQLEDSSVKVLGGFLQSLDCKLVVLRSVLVWNHFITAVEQTRFSQTRKRLEILWNLSNASITLPFSQPNLELLKLQDFLV